MRKMKLDIDSLAIESFPTVRDGGAERGTVRGMETLRLCSGDYTCLYDATCMGDHTCASACSETNGAGHYRSCGPCCAE